MSDNSGSSLRAIMYGENDLSSTELFSGHFINFGYWKDLTPGERISWKERTESQASLYRTVLSRLKIDPSDVLLEVGCGIGVGAALALREFEPSAVWGVDYSQDQLDRAIRVHAEMLAKHPDRLVFRQGSALALPFEDSKFSKCFSVEAAQHFEDLAAFAAEAHRVLKPGGKLSAATFFTPHATAIRELRRLIDTIERGIDVVCPIDSFRDDLLRAGFADVHVESIGDHVWHGFDAWMEQTEFKDSWGRNWLKAHDDGLVDYYLVTAITE